MDKFNAMRSFVTIVDSGSLTAAANKLHTSLPSVVRTLASLEKHVGVRLLNRTTRRISVTEAGARYLKQCRDILSALENAEAELGIASAKPSGTVVVTAPVLFGEYHVAPILTDYLKQHVDVKGNLLLLDRMVNLIEEGIDVGVRIGELSDSSLVAQTVGKVRFLTVASPAYLKKHGTPNHPKELAQLDCITRTGDNADSWSFYQGRKRFRVPVKNKLECNLNAPAIDACVNGLGFGRFLSYQIIGPLATKKLRVVLAEYEPPAKPVNIVYPSRELLPAKTRLLIELLKKELPRKLH
jgi:DNA-binding transcriptional LysR family regulator